MERPVQKIESPESPLPKYLKMYEIPGQNQITEHSFDRYKEDKIRNNEKIDLIITKNKEKKISPLVHEINESLFTPNSKTFFLIKEGLANSDPEVQKAAAEAIKFISEDEITPLIEEGLSHLNPEVQIISSETIWFAPKTQKGFLREIVLQKIKNGLNSTDSEVQITSAKLLDNAPVTKTLSLIEEGLNHSNPEVQKISAENIRFAPENMIANLIRECLKHPNPKVQVESVKIIERAFGDERSTLIREGLSHSNPEVQITSALMMGDAPKDEITLLIKDGFNHPNPEVQKISAENIRFAPVNERASLIREGLSHSNLEIQILSVDNINFVSEPEKPSLWKNVLLRIRQSLESVDPKVQTSSIGMIDYIPKNERKGLYKLMKEKGLEEYLIKPALYKNGAVRKEKFSRANFDKTGSETILLGGDLKDKTIIREITPEAFLSWQSIYENWKLWQQAGFDYVPIEPIQSFSINKNGSIRVYSGVLDLSLARWKEISTKFESELEEQKNKIKAVLSSINFEHGHPHDGNFCLRFFRNENGKPDFNRFPRLYLIDFDQAFSPGK